MSGFLPPPLPERQRGAYAMRFSHKIRLTTMDVWSMMAPLSVCLGQLVIEFANGLSKRVFSLLEVVL